METESEVRPVDLAKPLDHLRLAVVWVELVRASDLRDYFDGCDQARISHFCPLLLQ